MNRTDRLYAIAEALRRVGASGTTGRRLAAELEVSERTIKRDISALQQSGLPIWAQAGPGGGYVLDASASLPPVNFTPQQAVAIAVALATLPGGSPFARDAAAAREKIWDTLGQVAAERAARLASRVWVDHGEPTAGPAGAPGGIGGDLVSRARQYLPVASAVEESLAASRVLAIRYRDARGAVTTRRVEPILLAHTRRQWYVVCWDQLRDAVRWFDLARMIRADLTPDRYQPRDVAIVGTPPVGARPVG